MNFKILFYILTCIIFFTKTINTFSNKNIQEQVDMLQLEVVKMSLQLSEMLKQKTGKGLDVSIFVYNIKTNK